MNCSNRAARVYQVFIHMGAQAKALPYCTAVGEAVVLKSREEFALRAQWGDARDPVTLKVLNLRSC